MTKLDITIEFYYKKAVYVSKTTKHRQTIEIKKVELIIQMKPNKSFILISSTNGAVYEFEELSEFSI